MHYINSKSIHNNYYYYSNSYLCRWHHCFFVVPNFHPSLRGYFKEKRRPGPKTMVLPKNSLTKRTLDMVHNLPRSIPIPILILINIKMSTPQQLDKRRQLIAEEELHSFNETPRVGPFCTFLDVWSLLSHNGDQKAYTFEEPDHFDCSQNSSVHRSGYCRRLEGKREGVGKWVIFMFFFLKNYELL